MKLPAEHCAYLNGTIAPLAETRVSVLDRGFLFGDGIYEMLPVYSKRPFRVESHLDRLEHSLAEMRLPNPLSREQWRAEILRIVDLHPWTDQSVYIQITRGIELRDQVFPDPIVPTVFITTLPLVVATAADKAAGVCAVSVADERWARCDVKSLNLLPNVLARQQAHDAGCLEAIQFDGDWLTEGAASTILVVRDGVVLVPPPSHKLLPGITCEVVLELAEANGIPFERRPVSRAEVLAADELWTASSTREVMAIVTLDGMPVGKGEPGPLAARMDALYQRYKDEVMRA